jgi:hypothetical protein
LVLECRSMTAPFDRSAAMMPSVRRLAPQLVIAGVLPLVGYVLLRPHVGSDATALAAVMVFPLLDIVIERHRHGRFEPIGIISLIGIAVGIIGAVVFHGNATLLKVRESLVTGLFGVVCLGSLAARRPTMYYLGRAFATGGDPEAVREFDTIWDLPGVPGRFRLITAVWGVSFVGEAVVRTVLAVSMPTRTFLIATPIINWGVLGALLWFTAAYRRRGEQQVRAVVGDGVEVTEGDVHEP